MSRTSPPAAVVLLQLGGPDSLESVEPFLYNLFSDPDIIDLPMAFLFRKPLARFIARRRAPNVRQVYARIGAKSPIGNLTRRQALALEREINKTLPARVYVAMRYWHPMTEETLEDILRQGSQRIVLLPLYPQYSRSTTGSSVNEWRRVVARRNFPLPDPVVVEEYCDHPLYVRSIVENIHLALRRVPERQRAKVHLLFSAHGTPLKLVREGDPYQGHVERTYRAVIKEGKFTHSHSLCYQSKVGPQKWLEPSLTVSIERLAAEKVSHLLVVPLAFVSDHSETLWEINMEAKHIARQKGIHYYDMSPALNTRPLFIQALAELSIKALGAQ
jgi:ferrochelatase